MNALASYIMRGPIQATLAVSGLAVISLLVANLGVLSVITPILRDLSAAGCALVMLRQGSRSAISVLLATCAAFIAVAYWYFQGPEFAANVAGFVILITVVALLAWVLRTWRTLPLTIIVAGGFGLFFVLALHIGTEPTVLWQNVITQYLSPVMDAADAELQSQLKEQIPLWAQEMTWLLASAFVLNCLVCLFVARWWQAMLYNPGGFRQEFHALRLGKPLAIVTAVVAVPALLNLGGISAVATDLFKVLMTLFFLQGLAVAHAVVTTKKLNFAWLVGFYVFAFFLHLFVAIVGFVDTWTNVRGKIQSKNGTT